MCLKSRKFHLYSLFLVALTINIGLITQTGSHEGEDHALAPSYHEWKVLDWNEEYPLIWWTKGINITTTIGSTLIYNVTHQNQGNITHPNTGFLTFGNVTNYETDNNEIADLLTLSIYPWLPGVFLDTNWADQIETAQYYAENGEYTKGDLKVNSSYRYQYGDVQKSAVSFDYKQGEFGNQNTTLVYELNTGLLLYAKTELKFTNLYKIELALNNTTLFGTIPEIDTTDDSTTFGFEVLPLFLGVLSIVYISKRSKNK